MRKLIYSMTVSLDGYIAGPDGAIDWSVPDEELFLFHAQQIQETDVHLCGRRLYEVMVYWETAEESQLVAEHVEFAQIWRALPKVVFSTTLESVVGNTRLARDGVGEEVSRLKEQAGKDVAVGGAGLARACMKLELIDEWRLFVSPVLLGGGTPYFPTLDERDQPGVGRDEDVWLSRRLPSLQARARRPPDSQRDPQADRRDCAAGTRHARHRAHARDHTESEHGVNAGWDCYPSSDRSDSFGLDRRDASYRWRGSTLAWRSSSDRTQSQPGLGRV